MTDAAGLISYLGTWVQLGGILLLLTLFRLLSRHAGTRSYFVIWAQAWLVLLVAVTAILLRYLLVPGLTPVLLAEKSPLATLLYLLYQSAKLLHLGLLVSGTIEFAQGRHAPRNWLPWAAAIGIYAAATVVQSPDLDRIVFWQGFIGVAVYATCAWLMLALPAERRTPGTRVTGVTFTLLAVLWVVYLLVFGGLQKVGPQVVASPLSTFAQFNSYFDIVLALLLGYGMVVILLEDSRREVDHARIARMRDVSASEARMVGLIGAATEAIVTLDESYCVAIFNPAAERMFHLTASAATGKPFSELIAPRARAQVEALLAQSDDPLNRPGPPSLFPGLRPDGTEAPLECSVSTRRLADSLMRIVVLNDVSERLAAEAEREQLTSRLAQSLRMEAVGRLVSGVAHELNNPLAAILTFSEDLLREPAPGLPTEPLVVIRDQAQRARAIVRDLLAFVRRREERREHIATNDLVERVTNAMRREIERLELRMEVEVGSGLPGIIGDSVGLEQVLTNLLDNAMRAAGKRGWVALRAQTVREGLQIVVEDSGEGIRPELLPRIFEPFFTTRAAGQGTGLGLSVSLGIVEQHGGRLTVENRPGPEHGARFTVLLPFGVAATDRRLTPRVPPVPVEDPLSSLPKAEPGRSPRVLIIDDEAPVRAAMRRFFERRGWTVEEAEDGQPGLAAVLAAPDDAMYDLVISDLKMPGMSGIDVHNGLAATKPALLRRLVIATGDTASPDAAVFLSKTRCPILEKPFALDDLARIADQVMGPTSPG